MLKEGLIIQSHGRHFNVEIDGHIYHATSKGKKTEFVVGDQVLVQILDSQQAHIEQLIPRQNLVYRSDQNRSKIIASNLDQILIVIAVKPNFNIHFLNSCLLCAESSQIKPVIIINKMDLPESEEFAKDIIKLYQDKLNYQLIQLTALDDCGELMNQLQNKRSLLIGQSGVGKSTITNQIYPQAQAKTAAIAKHENSGTHTTTHATLYHINQDSELIDCPGLQEFGLYHLESSQLAEYFPEMREHLGMCKFSNCLHLAEPSCIIQGKVTSGEINPLRYAFYQRLVNNLKLKKNY